MEGYILTILHIQIYNLQIVCSVKITFMLHLYMGRKNCIHVSFSSYTGEAQECLQTQFCQAARQLSTVPSSKLCLKIGINVSFSSYTGEAQECLQTQFCQAARHLSTV